MVDLLVEGWRILVRSRACNQLVVAILSVGIAMTTLDRYVTDVLLRDLVAHDRRPVSFLVYLWLAAEQQEKKGAVQISYRELAENIGVSKSAAQAAVAWLVRRKLITASKENVTATPSYLVLSPWRTSGRAEKTNRKSGGA
jgi:hypothetical protein